MKNLNKTEIGIIEEKKAIRRKLKI